MKWCAMTTTATRIFTPNMATFNKCIRKLLRMAKWIPNNKNHGTNNVNCTVFI